MKDIPTAELAALLSQYLPAEVADVIPTLGIADVIVLDGRAAVANSDGKLSVVYRFRLSIEVVVDGEGKAIQFAQISSNLNDDSELNQNEAGLSLEEV